MSSCVIVNADPVFGDVENGPVAAFYFLVPAESGFGVKEVCIKLVGTKETIYIVVDRWPAGSAVIRSVTLPVYAEQGVPLRDTGGTVLWDGDGPALQFIKRYERLTPTAQDREMWNAAQLLYHQCTPMPCMKPKAAGGSGAVAALNAYEAAADAARAEKGASLNRLVANLGPGYLVERLYFVAEDMSRVLTRGGEYEPWVPQPFTREILRVLLTFEGPGGLTSAEIYDKAKEAFKGTAAPYPKSLGQFFRIRRGKKVFTHPIARAARRVSHKPETYAMTRERVEPGDPKMVFFGTTQDAG